MTIPERQPIADSFHGYALKHQDGTPFLAREVLAETILASGTLIVRYAIQYLGKPHWSIVPGLIALDYGDMLTGEDAWEFLLNRSNLHPRADVLGYRNDGEDEMITVKRLDLAQPVQVLVYADAQATIPCAQPAAVITAENDLPPHLLEYLPRYSTLAEWETARHE
ncbi:MAG: hypothetical protein K8L99_10975 [Anaerolineae bacterium]|nr:hypothetical protein [Anaerolineae bacterium]